jgi:HSP20 family protein
MLQTWLSPSKCQCGGRRKPPRIELREITMPRELETLLRRALFSPAIEALAESYWQPSADIYQTSSGWLVKFDLAGVRPDEIEVRLESRGLTVSGVRRDWSIAESQHSYSMEISYNRFQRTVKLPCEVVHARTSTEYRDGMLLVRLECEGTSHHG